MKRCVIIGAVETDYPYEKLIKDTDFVICADKGWLNAKAHGIKPNMIVGDFDSSPKPENTDTDIVVLPVVKDDTDTFHIARYVVENDFTDVLLCGLLGGARIEHTIANIQTLLFFAKRRVNATMIDSHSQLMVIHNGKVSLPEYGRQVFLTVFHGGYSGGRKYKGSKIPP